MNASAVAGVEAVGREDVKAIVAYVAHQLLKEEYMVASVWNETHHKFPALKGLTKAQIEHAIREALA